MIINQEKVGVDREIATHLSAHEGNRPDADPEEKSKNLKKSVAMSQRGRLQDKYLQGMTVNMSICLMNQTSKKCSVLTLLLLVNIRRIILFVGISTSSQTALRWIGNGSPEWIPSWGTLDGKRIARRLEIKLSIFLEHTQKFWKLSPFVNHLLAPHGNHGQRSTHGQWYNARWKILGIGFLLMVILEAEQGTLRPFIVINNISKYCI